MKAELLASVGLPPQVFLAGFFLGVAEALALAAQRAAEVGEPWLTRLCGDELAVRLRLIWALLTQFI